jgi:hypothetical protein
MHKVDVLTVLTVLTINLWSGWKTSFNHSNLSECKLPTSTVHICILSCDNHRLGCNEFQLTDLLIWTVTLRGLGWGSAWWMCCCLPLPPGGRPIGKSRIQLQREVFSHRAFSLVISMEIMESIPFVHVGKGSVECNRDCIIYGSRVSGRMVILTHVLCSTVAASVSVLLYQTVKPSLLLFLPPSL